MKTYKYTLTDNKPLGTSTRLLTLTASDKNYLTSFKAGQYAGISYRSDGGYISPLRFFSLASSPTNTKVLQFGMRVSGSITTAMASLGIGTPFLVYGPCGSMVFDDQESRPRPLVMIAGGIGITPFMSMIRRATEQRLQIPFMLLFSNKTRNDIPVLDDLRELAAINPYFLYLVTLTDDPETYPLGPDIIKGRIDEATLQNIVPFAPGIPDYYLCGPSLFMNAMENLLTARGVPAESVFMEAFSKSAKARGYLSTIPPLVYATAAIGLFGISVSVALSDIAKHEVQPVLADAISSPTSTPSAIASTPAPTPQSTPVPVPMMQPRSAVS